MKIGKLSAISGVIIALGFGFIAWFLWSTMKIAKKEANQDKCRSQLKSIGLAARIWSDDHNGVFPSNFVEMSNELSNPDILICPADSKRVGHRFTNLWAPENFTYEFILPEKLEYEAQTNVIIRCPIHGFVVLGNGSVEDHPKSK